MYIHNSVNKYIRDLGAKKATPGGGSAAALCSSLGASLVCMVINFSLGKPGYEKYRPILKKALVKYMSLSKQLLRLVDEDVAAYKSKNLTRSLAVPAKVCSLCFEGILGATELIDKTNPMLISDLGIALELFAAGFKSGYYNVEINIRFLHDTSKKRKLEKELENKWKIIKNTKLITEARIGKIIRR
ncbi:MAG: cyclodeaminase/cyclohydrolase family protein [Candidatus Omnitrophota bacterium]|nr:cyclodeaminase/cyclohydrolase family protein [Candidatus Omnitrophota bacterium]